MMSLAFTYSLKLPNEDKSVFKEVAPFNSGLPRGTGPSPASCGYLLTGLSVSWWLSSSCVALFLASLPPDNIAAMSLPKGLAPPYAGSCL